MSKTDEKLLPEQEENISSETSEDTENKASSEEEVEDIDPIAKLHAELKDINDKYLRLYSEFDNFRRRSMKERLDLIKTASESVILSLLPVLDDLERALSSIQDETTKSGFELIHNKLKTTLESQGLKAMETKDVAFDAELHEAVAQTPAENKAKKGMIVDEVQRGYHLYDKVIRHAKVVVAN